MDILRDKERRSNIRFIILVFIVLSGIAAALLYFPPIPTRTEPEKIEFHDIHNAPVTGDIKTYDEARTLKKELKSSALSIVDVPDRGEVEVEALASKHIAVKLKLNKVDGGKIILDDLGKKNPVSVQPPGKIVKYVEIGASNVSYSSASITISYSDAELNGGNEKHLRIYHWNGISWDALPTEIDMANKTLRATSSSLSPFGVATDPVYYLENNATVQSVGADGNTDYNASGTSITVIPYINLLKSGAMGAQENISYAVNTANNEYGVFRFYLPFSYPVDTQISANATANISWKAVGASDKVNVSLIDYNLTNGVKTTIGSAEFTATGGATDAVYPVSISNPQYTIQAGNRLMAQINTITQTAGTVGLYFNDGSSNITVTETSLVNAAQPNITSWGNNKTGDKSSSISIYTNDPIRFNATVNQTITTWNWYQDGVNQNNNYDNLTTSWNTSGTKSIQVNATNGNGTSNTITWIVTVQAQPEVYVPPPPSNINSTTGNFWVNTTWLPETGNTTDSYNISVNGAWTNGTTNTSVNSSLSAHSWQNVTVYAYNASGSGSLSTPAMKKTQIPDNPPVQPPIGAKSVDEGQWLNFTINAADADNDTITYGTNATKGSFDATTGNFSWLTTYSDAGTYIWYFNSSDGYGGIASETVTVTVNNIPLSVTSFSPPADPMTLEGTEQIFNITLNRTASVTWYMNGTQVQTDTGTTSAGYTNSTAAAGTWNVTASATDGIDTVSKTWNWTVNAQPPTTYIPPNPTNLQNATGNFWVNSTWQAGSVNNTDSYNVSVNGTWYNSTTSAYYNNSVGSHGWSNVTVWAYNSSGTGSLSPGSMSQNTQVPNNPPIQSPIGNKTINEGQPLNFTVSATDLDNDTITYGTNATKGTLNTTTGKFTWTPSYGDAGVYIWYFNSSEGYGGVASENITVTVNNVPLSIMNSSPASDPTTIVGTPQTFAISLNRTANVTWYINGSVMQTNPSTASANYTNSTAGIGTYNVTAAATDGYYSTSKQWNWTVNSQPVYAPSITSWSNSKTNNNSPTLAVNTSETVNFNATANQTITTWDWYQDGVNQNNNYDNFTTSWSTAGTKTIQVNATNSNGTSNTITWNITVQAQPVAYIPPSPANINSTTGNFWVNTTWQAGIGNTTDSYNVITNGTWTNGTTSTSVNSSLSAHAWQNVTVYAFNASGGDSLSASPATKNTQIPNNPPIQEPIGNKFVNEGQWLNFTVNATDADNDTITYGTNATKGIFNATTGNFSWLTTYSDAGTYVWYFNSSEGYGGVASEIITVTVNNTPLSIASFSPSSDPTTTQGTAQTFNVTLNRTANVTWYMNGAQVQTDTGTTSAGYTNSTAAAGTWNVTASATDNIDTTSKVWNWTVNVQSPITYIPPNPINLQNTTGNFWVNHTWYAGSGNTTDSYNVSINGTWHNGTINTYYNSTVGSHGWSNISVYSYNSSGTGTLNNTAVSQNAQVLNNPVTIGNVSSNYTLTAEDTLSIYPTSSDLDGDTPTFARNFTKGTFYTNNGTLLWTTTSSDVGSYYWQINVTDGYGSVSLANFTVTVNAAVVAGVNLTNISTLFSTTTPGENATYVLNLTNNGTATDNYTITVSNPNSASTAATNITSATLAAGASKLFALNVTNTAAGTFIVNVTAISGNDPTTFGYVNTTTTVTTAVVAGVNLTNISALSSTTPAGTNATYVLNLTNNGTNADSYTLAVFNVNNASTAALNITSPVFLNAGANKIFALNVTNTAAGTFIVNVTANSTNDPTKFGYVNTTTTVLAEGPNCVQCHNLETGLSGGAPVGINFTAVNLSVHFGINSQNATNQGYAPVVGACWACHDSDGNVTGGHPDMYKTPKTCVDCHLANGTYYNQAVSWGLNVTVSEHYYGGDKIVAGNSSSNISSCFNCHENVSEMLLYNNVTDNYYNFSGNYGVGGNQSFFHYGKNRSDLRSRDSGISENCSYCHQNASTAFNIAMVDPTWNSSIANHSTNYNSTNPGCTNPTCHNTGWIHNSTLNKPVSSDTLCKTCHGTGGSASKNNKSEHKNLYCTECHANSTNGTLAGKDIHPVKYLLQNNTYSTSNSSAVNCTTCHQGTSVDSSLVGFAPPKIVNPLHHSDNPSNGSVWNGTQPGYWINTTPQTACIYCHNDTKHSATPLGRALQWKPNYVLYGNISANLTCADCHYKGDSNYTQMSSTFASAGLTIPPEITNGTNWNGVSSFYYNHTLNAYDDQTCKTCHGTNLNTGANMSEFLHNVNKGGDCKGCHFDFTFMNNNGAPESYVNSTMYNSSTHGSLNCEDCHTKGHNNIGARKACEDCHAVQTIPITTDRDRHDITATPSTYLYNGTSVVKITDCTTCHDPSLYNNATTLYGLPPKAHNCDYCHTYPTTKYP